MKKRIFDIKVKNPRPELCQHDPSSKTNTLLYIEDTILQTPRHLFFYCKYCGRGFEYIQDVNGELVEITNDNEEVQEDIKC